MMNRNCTKRKIPSLLVLSLALMTAPLLALEVPAWNGPVNDLAQVMTAQQRQELTEYLTNLNKQTGIQMAVLTVPSLEGDSIEDFSFRTASAWQLGQEKEDNGALLVVSEGDRELRIEVGYGLEGLLTDAKSGLIIRNVITPHFRNGDYGTGIVEGIKNMVGVATEDAQLISAGMTEEEDSVDSESLVVSIIFFSLYFAILVFAINKARKSGKGGRSGGGGSTIRMPPPTFTSSSSFGSTSFSTRSGLGGGFSSGGGSFGGGFSGGGGSFGGGGASGKW